MKARHMWCNSLLSYRYLLLTSKNDASIHNPRSMTTQVNSYSLIYKVLCTGSARDWTMEWNSFVSRMRFEWSYQDSVSSFFAKDRNRIASNPTPTQKFAFVYMRIVRYYGCVKLLKPAAGSNARLDVFFFRFWLLLVLSRFNRTQLKASQSNPTVVSNQAETTPGA